MEKSELLREAKAMFEAWESVITELGTDGLETEGVTGDWRVRDVLVHFNGYERWQLVQLHCAFTGETPTEDELTGGIPYEQTSDLNDDAMNAMFVNGARELPTEEVVRHWREVSAMRADWISSASQEQLDELIGADWTSGSSQIIRLASEVPSVSSPMPVWKFLLDHVEHQKEHLPGVREWMNRYNKGQE